MKLRTLGALFAVLFAITGLTASFALISVTDSLHSTTVALEKSVEGVYAAEELEIAIILHNRDLFLAGLMEDEAYRTSADKYASQIPSLIRMSQDLVESDEELEQLKKVESRANSYLADSKRNLENGLPPSAAFLESTKSLELAYLATEELVQMNRLKALERLADSDARSELADRLGIVTIGFLILIIASSLLVGTRYLLRPLAAVSRVVREFGREDLKSRIAARGPTELVEIGHVFNEMADRLERNRISQVRFLASVAHDIRNPLSAIKTSADFLRLDDNMEPEDQKSILAIISRQVGLLDTMVGDLLEVAKAESGQLQIRPGKRDICRLVVEAAKLHDQNSPIHKIRVTGTSLPIYCHCDGLRISQVLNNFLSNAIKYTPHGGRITIDCQANDGEGHITVTDEGIGIDEDELESIFQPFRRSKSTRDTIPGVGLGLATSRKIIEAHGGKISVQSGKAKGSSFTITLPLSPKSEKDSDSLITHTAVFDETPNHCD